ncbi:hypothetical protein MNVI_43490 [Mycobacterium noviomagense]|uniref:Serine protease n=1 Tax=Mycobacterium noviomagense TaxID=459858 RepID=A0A7I7PKC8_9MYCO|nr:hypothetical protein BST37_16830 [Mycobacterium noviomagense]BBY09031.1 hypothetical protein MNVI_43490 [Mycobacterium noviomagense]
MTQARHGRAVGHADRGPVPVGMVGTDGVVHGRHELRYHHGIHRRALHRPLPSRSGGSDHIAVPDAIQTDAAINPGSSGGALVDMNGALVGVNCAIAVVADDSGQGRIGSTGLGFAIPADHAKRVADALIADGVAPRT